MKRRAIITVGAAFAATHGYSPGGFAATDGRLEIIAEGNHDFPFRAGAEYAGSFGWYTNCRWFVQVRRCRGVPGCRDLTSLRLFRKGLVISRSGHRAATIEGWVAPGFEGVREAFARNFERGREIGAACAAFYRGEKVVDLWGGYRDRARTQPWREDTLVLVFSTTKGMAATAMAVAHSRGWLDFDAPVNRYWPEFAQAGKERITIRQLLSHQAGLPAVDQPLDPKVLGDLDGLAAILARQKPAWEPGRRHGYHGLSLGWYQNELIRRVDPGRRSIGKFFQEEVARPLGVEFYIGLPRDLPESRLADVRAYHPAAMLLHLNKLPPAMVLSLMWPRSLGARSLMNPRFKSPADLGAPSYRHLELASGNGIGQARAIARVYGVLATGGKELGISERTMRELIAPPVVPIQGQRDAVLKVDVRYSLGFMRRCRAFPYGSSDKVFGAQGAGGSIGFADPDAQIGWAYTPNKMGFCLYGDPREVALREAVYGAIGKPAGG